MSHNWLDNEEILGDIGHQETVSRVEIHRGDHFYQVKADRRSHSTVDCINIGGAASGMSDNSMMELGGDRTKRVTITDVNGQKYAFVEVGDR